MSGPSRTDQNGRTQDAVSGVSELNLHPYSGLRCANIIGCYIPDQASVLSSVAVGGTGGASVTEWTTLTINGHGHIFFGVTPVAQVVQGTPAIATIQLRVDGYDQFGNAVRETTPVVDLTAVTNNWIYLSRVFVFIERIQFKSTVLDIAADTINFGSRFDWTRTEDASNHHIAGQNLGLGIPFQVASRPLGDATGTYKLDGLPKAPAKATSELQFTGPILPTHTVPTAGEIVTIDGKDYTWRDAPVPAGDGNVAIDADNKFACRDNLINAINKGPGEGTAYGLGTVQHPTVVARVSKRQPALAENIAALEVEAKVVGTLANNIPLAESMADGDWIDITGVSDNLYGGELQYLEAYHLQFSGFPATGYLTFSGQPLDTETVVIGTETYTFNTVLGGSGSVLIGATTEDSIDNLVAAINNAAGEGTTYGTGTPIHPTVRAVKRSATVLRVNATTEVGANGRDGNSIATTETVGTASWGAATLQGGWGHADHSGIDPEHILIGFNEIGWEGTLDKLHLLQLDQISENWPTNTDQFVNMMVRSARHA